MSKTKNSYIQHIRNNELIQCNADQNRWYCILCGESFSFKSDVRRHLFGRPSRPKPTCKVVNEQQLQMNISQPETDSE